ncbi:hypothetical protein BDY24DRAFT_439753, partial [Mrakia frigida]|uniref:uncharacterized protein n=1 Tax=Mrakia frigida TaxID=29902 RepID=UPI003FCC0EFA
MSSPPSSPTHANVHPVGTSALSTTFLVARKVSSSSSSRSQVPRRSFPPDTFSSRIRTSQPSPLGPKGGRNLARPSLEHKEEGDDWSSDDEEGGGGGEEEVASTTEDDDDDDGDLGVVKRARSRKFAKGVGKMRFFSAPNGRRRERTPSYSPKKDNKNDGPPASRLAASSSSPFVSPSHSLPSSPSKPLRATSTPFTPTASRTLIYSAPTTSPSQHPTKQPSFSPESIGSGTTSFQNISSPTSSQSSWSLITPGIPQTDLFDTSIDSIIIVHDPPSISDKFLKGPSTTATPASLPTVITTAPTPTSLSPFARPFVFAQTRVYQVERSIGFAELMGRGMGREVASSSSSSMQEKAGSPERQVLIKGIMRAVTPSKPSREKVAERMARLIMKRSVGLKGAEEQQGGECIAVMVGPESLPYARNP